VPSDTAAPAAEAPVIWRCCVCDAREGGAEGIAGDADPRGGCGWVKSCLGVCPNSEIC